MTRRESQYVHGSDPDEQRRLTLLNTLINEPALRDLDIQPGMRVLDVGSGLAQLGRAMGKAAGSTGFVLGIERDVRQLAEARRQAAAAGESDLIEMREGDVTNPPLHDDEWGSFDIVFCRFVLEHLSSPIDAVRMMVRAARPGGRIVLADDDHELLRLWPQPAGFATLWIAYGQTYEVLGNDPLIGRKLVALLVEAGATPVRNTYHFFGSCAGQPVFPSFVENLISILVGASQTMFDHHLIDESTFQRGLTAVREWSARPDASFWYQINWAEGVKT